MKIVLTRFFPLPAADWAPEDAAAGLDVDKAAAGRAAVAAQPVTGAADFQALAVGRVVRNAATVTHEGDSGLEKICNLGRDGWKRLLTNGLRGGWLPSPVLGRGAGGESRLDWR